MMKARRKSPGLFVFISRELLFLGELVLNLGNGVANGGDGAGLLIGDLDSEHALELHEKLHGVEGIGSKVICKIRSLGNFGLFYSEFVNDYRLDLFYNFLFSHD